MFITKQGSPINSNSKFIIISRGVFLSSFKNKLWLTLCDKLLILYLYKLYNKFFNLGLLLLLLVYYLIELINLKTHFFKNFIKFYTKDERLGSIGNYYLFPTLTNFTLYITTLKALTNELFFDFTNSIYFIKHPFEFDHYYTFIKSQFNFNKLNLLLFDPLEA